MGGLYDEYKSLSECLLTYIIFKKICAIDFEEPLKTVWQLKNIKRVFI
jgi:hypothetical protein